MHMDFILESIPIYILVFARMGGMIFFNPLLARKNIPSQFRVALVLGITILVTPTLLDQAPTATADLTFIWMLMKELLVGFACGFVMQIFYYLLFTAGDVIDMGFGLSMAKALDPGANVQVSMSGNFFQMLFILYIFADRKSVV